MKYYNGAMKIGYYPYKSGYKVTKKNDLVNKLCALIFCLMPLHYYICVLLISQTSIDNVFRDFVIIFSFIVITKGIVKLSGTLDCLIAINVVTIIIFALLSLIISDISIGSILNISRTYIVPMLGYYVFKNLRLDKEKFNRAYNCFITIMVIVVVYGAFQAIVLGSSFIIKLGYPGLNGSTEYLESSSFYISGFFGMQRNTGTFVSPNICGIVTAIALCMVVFKPTFIEIKFKTLKLLLLLFGLIVTYSRSAILGLLLGVIICKVYQRSKKNSAKIKINFKAIIIASIIIFAAFIVLLRSNNSVFDMIFSSFHSISRGEASASFHIQSLYEPFFEAVMHPFGYGIGKNGPLALNYLSPNSIHLVESSVYLMMFELGPLFGMAHFIPYIHAINKSIKNEDTIYIAAANIAVLFSYLLLPNIQEFIVPFYCYAIMGLGSNLNIKKSEDIVK